MPMRANCISWCIIAWFFFIAIPVLPVLTVLIALIPKFLHILCTSERTCKESAVGITGLLFYFLATVFFYFVSDETTVFDIINFLHHRRHILSLSGLANFMFYLPGRFIALQEHETMQELGVSSLTQFHLHLRIPGGASMSLDQCALNKDGSLKDALEIQFYHDVDSIAPLNASSFNAPAAKGKVKAVNNGIGSNDKVDEAYEDADSDSEEHDSDLEEEEDI
ncbi:hypothetical protein EDD85DRAFT_785181 [Armillaria nabsnona]|nr:hypothetical protein EDD85DRAFT_785181 [Armillaria nabsnona]